MRFIVFYMLIGCFGSVLFAQTQGVVCSYESYLQFLETDDSVNHLIVHDEHLFALTDSGLVVFDISAPADPVLVGTLESEIPYYHAARVGENLFCIDGQGFRVINIANPENPFIDGYLLGYFGNRVGVSGDRAYVASTYSADLHILDISNPYFPMYSQEARLDGECLGVLASGSKLYVASPDAFTVYDLTFPDVPKVVGELPIGADGHIKLDGDRLYMPGSGDGGVVVDVADPQSPEILGSFGSGVSYLDLAVSNGRVYGLRSDGLFDINGAYPDLTLRSSFLSFSGGYSVATYGGVAYLGGDDGIQLIDVEHEPQSPQAYMGGELEHVANVAVLDGHMFIANEREGFCVYDIRDPALPVLVHEELGLERDASVHLNGEYLYVTQDDGHPLVFDVRVPSAPVLAGRLELQSERNFIEIVHIEDGFMLTGEQEGYVLYDVHDPLDPAWIANLDTTASFVKDADIDGDRLYISIFVEGIDVFDLSDPEHPEFAFHFPVQNATSEIEVRDGIVFSADPQRQPRSYVRVYDLRDPATAQQVGIYETRRSLEIEQVELLEDLLYIRESALFTIVRVSDPSDPVQIGQYLGRGPFVLDQGHAFFAEFNRLRVLDVRAGCGVCSADLNADGSLNFFDVAAFLTGYQAQDAFADWNGDGAWNFFDVSGFLMDYFVGCP